MAKRSKRWTSEETKAFLHFYGARKDEFNQARKKRLAYSNVVEDMISAGFDSDITPRNLEVKMQTLLRAYKDAKDDASRTGASPCTAPFMDEMEELFGDKPIHSKSETINLGSELIPSTSDAPVSVPVSSNTPSTAGLSFLEIDAEVASSSAPLEINFTSLEATPASHTSDVVAVSATSQEAAASSSTTPAKIKIRRRAMSRSDYYKEKLKQREREMQAAEERFTLRQREREKAQLEKTEARKATHQLIEKLLKK